MSNRIVNFIRKKDLKFVRELGRGACGETVLFYDDVIDLSFVCKKYAPYDDNKKSELFQNFLREIKLLHLLYHQNVVRVFNYYLYPENYTGYIFMEYIEGTDVADFLRAHPNHINEIFMQTISGFCYLEEHNILHRDIRPSNLMVSKLGQVKVIDFGFGKKIATQKDFDKSISLNWWCELPFEFESQRYDYTTEVYFIGKLFKKIILENNIEEFQHSSLLARMCTPDPMNRIKSFSDVQREALSAGFGDVPFAEDDLVTYRNFSKALYSVLGSIEQDTKYITDSEQIKLNLENVYRNISLEEYLPQNALLTRCFLDGQYKYYYVKPGHRVSVSAIKAFLDLFRSCSTERKQIILSNLYTKLDSLKRYDASEKIDDIPF